VNNLYKVLEDAAANYPENVALSFINNLISYKEVKEAADRLASGLKNLGLGQGDRVALMLPNVPQFLMSYFALLKIGAVIVPVSIHYKAEEIHHQLEDSEAKGFIFWKDFRPSVRQAIQGLERCKTLIVLGEKAESGEVRLPYLMEINEPLEETVDVEPDDMTLIVYAAGATGCHMGAELTHQNILFSIDAVYKFLKLDSEDSVIGALPLYHPLGQTLVVGPFFKAGARVTLVPKFNAEEILKTIETEKSTYFIGVPSMIREILKVKDGEKFEPGSLKFCLSTGDVLRKETMENFEARFKIPILEGYGLTEASGMVSFNSPVQEREAGSIGLPLPGIEIKIVDETDTEVKPGQVGEIIVKGPNVMKGYLNRPEATKEALRDGWLRTGDLALLHDNGFGFIMARKKNVIVKSGFNIYPREVERFLCGHPKVKEAVVVGIPDPVLGEEIHASVVLKEGESATQEEIIEYSKERMAAYKCPKAVHFVSSFPRGPMGRIMRYKIRESLCEK